MAGVDGSGSHVQDQQSQSLVVKLAGSEREGPAVGFAVAEQSAELRQSQVLVGTVGFQIV